MVMSWYCSVSFSRPICHYSEIHLCSVNSCLPLVLLWEPPGEEMSGSYSRTGLTACAHINSFLHLRELEVKSCHVLQPQGETNVPILHLLSMS